ncbi:hypothetical protein PB2503_05182 [Parvularcula bermudensis HTCC2503]|uniref:Uncharacterized protein n=1 Tax=Parvularcula bermudensis (strain ATCC BAA-594 / HTCC2503 / KCTC 12087) TaxID=314260 RepID=E0TFU6_PARBH|nr:hypothetical protein PB2503_05182 [Parvularcula bermudensis HTCC2503]
MCGARVGMPMSRTDAIPPTIRRFEKGEYGFVLAMGWYPRARMITGETSLKFTAPKILPIPEKPKDQALGNS